MQTTIPTKRMDEILAEITTKRVGDIRTLLNNNGVNANDYTDNQVRIAFLKALKDSATFRNNVSAYLADYVQSNHSFVSQPAMQNFMENPQQNFVDQPQLGFSSTFLASANTSITNAAEEEKEEAKTGTFWSSLGGLASKENLQTLFNTGLNAASAALTSKANQASEERALELERIRLQQLQTQKEMGLNADGSKKGISALGWVGIALGTGLLITGIVLIVKKKK